MSNTFDTVRDARYWIFADNQYADIFQIFLADTDILPLVS